MAEDTHIVTSKGKLVVINIPKNASQSIVGSLGVRRGHRPRALLELEHPEPDTTFIACVRHPLDRLVSWHAYHAPANPTVYFGPGVNGFRLWVNHGCPHEFDTSAHPMTHPYEQCRWITGATGNLRIIRFETLAEDWERLRDDFPELPPTLLHRNASKHRPWIEYYDDKTRGHAECITWADMQHPQVNGGILSHAEMNYLTEGSPSVGVFDEVWLGMCITPDRLSSARHVLTKLLSNLVPPTGIIVTIPHLLKRTGQSYDETLLTDIGTIDPRIKIVRCEDQGPVTKYLGLLRAVENAKALCIVVDDDMDYPPQLIERMSRAYITNNCQVLANSTLRVKQSDWLVPEGFAGVAFLRGLIDLPHLESYVRFTEQLPAAWLADDAVMGFYFHTVRARVTSPTIRVLPTPTIPRFDFFALRNIGSGHVERYRLVIDWLRQNFRQEQSL